MKKIFIVLLMVITLSNLLSSCTEEVIKVDTDKNGKGESSNPPL